MGRQGAQAEVCREGEVGERNWLARMQQRHP
jgi:hypothetical protein